MYVYVLRKTLNVRVIERAFVSRKMTHSPVVTPFAMFC